MAAQEVVNMIVLYLQDQGATMQDRFGPEAVTATTDTIDVITSYLGDVESYTALWEDFMEQPEDNSAELIGVLEAVIEAEPQLARRMESLLYEYQVAQAVDEEEPGAEQNPPRRRPSPVEPLLADREVDVPDPDLRYEEERTPYRPHTMAQQEYNDSVERGTYLYGNVKAGTDNVEEGFLDTTTYSADAVAAETHGLTEVEIPPFFDEMSMALAQHPALSAEDRRRAEESLRRLQGQISRVEAADAEAVSRHLQELAQLSPDVTLVLLNLLIDADVSHTVHRAIQKAREKIAGGEEQGTE